jgi:hypothetical protein
MICDRCRDVRGEKGNEEAGDGIPDREVSEKLVCMAMGEAGTLANDLGSSVLVAPVTLS